MLISRNRDYVLGNTMVGLVRSGDPDVHLQGRRALQPAFRRASVDAHWSELVRLSERAVERWPEGEVLDVLGELRKLTIEIFASVVLGAELGIPTHEALVHVRAYLDQVVVPASPTRRLVGRLQLARLLRLSESFETLLAALTRALEERRRNRTDGDDALELLVRAQGGIGLSERQLAMEAFALLLGAVETPAGALAWVLYLLAQDPRALARVRAETDAAPSSGAAAPPAGDELPYTHAVFKEAMRLYPPSWLITRRSAVDHTLGRHRVPKGALVWVIPYVVHRDERWYREPDRFLPERWLDGSQAGSPKLSYLPFGAGPQQCMGELLAWRELAAIVPAVLRRWDFVLPRGVVLAPEPKSTMRPAGGLPLLLTRRVDAHTRTEDASMAGVA